jgi:hypothetical protein
VSNSNQICEVIFWPNLIHFSHSSSAKFNSQFKFHPARQNSNTGNELGAMAVAHIDFLFCQPINAKERCMNLASAMESNLSK